MKQLRLKYFKQKQKTQSLFLIIWEHQCYDFSAVVGLNYLATGILKTFQVGWDFCLQWPIKDNYIYSIFIQWTKEFECLLHMCAGLYDIEGP